MTLGSIDMLEPAQKGRATECRCHIRVEPTKLGRCGRSTP